MDRLLTAVERERLRELIDCARRAAINWQAVMRCRGCGVEQLDSSTGEPRYVAGCRPAPTGAASIAPVRGAAFKAATPGNAK